MPHTGTVFTRELLDSWRVEHTSHHTDDLGYPLSYVSEGTPIVVPHRDPMLAEISRVNRGSGLPVKEWSKVSPWADRRKYGHVHWFKVPPGTVDIANLAWFCDLDHIPRWGSAARNTWNDPDGLKQRYAKGDIDESLQPAFDWLRGAADVQDLFKWLGYNPTDIPWMEAA